MNVQENLEKVRTGIAEAALRSGRTPEEVRLIAVSKGHGADLVRAAADLGQTEFGENRAQELDAKAPGLPNDLVWHFIGRLQTNKVSRVIRHDPVIHSLDRLSLAGEIDRRATKRCPVLVEVNVSGEPSKGGVPPGEAAELIRSVCSKSNLEFTGLMTMAPMSPDPEAARTHFRALRSLKERLEREIHGLTIHHLSMGMSQDYVVAIEEGATMVRIGEAIFGNRRHGRSEKR